MKLASSAPEDRRRQILLVGLLGVVLAVYYFYVRVPADARPAASNQVAGRGAAATADLPLPEPVKLADLGAAPEVMPVGRNPFTFGVRPAPPPPKPVALPPPVAIPAPVAPPQPVGPPPIPLKLTGFIKPTSDGRVMVTLKDPVTSTMYQAFEGDIVDGRYRIVKIGLQSVVVSYVDGSGSRTIPLGG